VRARTLSGAERYLDLVRQRIQADEGWNSDPITSDVEMNIAYFDFSGLDRFVAAYMKAVAADLAWWRIWR
jgi:hypothetical protein